MKIFLRIISWFLGIVLLVIVLLYVLDYEYLLKGFRVVYLTGHTTAYIDDHPNFDNNTIKAGEFQPWPLHENYNETDEPSDLLKLHEDLGTAAFLIIKNDSIWFEKYYNGYRENSLTNSFSMAKTITTALLAKAIEDGAIKSLEQPVKDFFPEFVSEYDSELTVGDLSSMASGLDWNEDYYNPFAHTARAYFDDDLEDVIKEMKIIDEPGKKFKYLSGNTLLLGMIIEKATGKTLSEYLSDSFWKPLGMEQDALWQVDSQESNIEKAYCCIASSAKDFARFGKLFKNYGEWNGKKVLDSAFIARAVQPRFHDSPEYGYGFWLAEYKGKDIFYMRGILGQYVIVIPEDDLIIVRLGENLIRKKEGEKHSPDFYKYIDLTYKMLSDAK